MDVVRNRSVLGVRVYIYIYIYFFFFCLFASSRASSGYILKIVLRGFRDWMWSVREKLESRKMQRF